MRVGLGKRRRRGRLSGRARSLRRATGFGFKSCGACPLRLRMNPFLAEALTRLKAIRRIHQAAYGELMKGWLLSLVTRSAGAGGRRTVADGIPAGREPHAFEGGAKSPFRASSALPIHRGP